MEKARVNGVELGYELLRATAGSVGSVGGPASGREGRRARGRGEAPVPVVLLNGIAMSIGSWKPFAEALAAEQAQGGGGPRDFLLHDFRGQLLSERPRGPYSLELHARDLAALLDHLGIGEVELVGTSYGSEVALVFARLFPARTQSLVVIDGVSEAGPLLRAAAASWRSAALADPVTFFRSLVPWTYADAYIGAHAELLAAREGALGAFPRDWFEAFAELCDAFLAIDETRHLAEIGAPTLVLVGSEDILKPERYARIIAEGIKGARLELLEGLGHGAVIEDPAGTARRVARFLSGPGLGRARSRA